MHIIAGINSKPKYSFRRRTYYSRGEARRYCASLLHFLFERKIIIILLSLFTAGILLGAAAVGAEGEVSVRLSRAAESIESVMLDSGFAASMKYSASVTVTAFATCLCAGMCAAGLPAIACVCAAKGISLGILCGNMYEFQGYKGLAKCLLLVTPGEVITTGALLIFCAEGIKMSCDTLLALSGRKQIKSNTMIKSYCLKFIAFLSLGVAGDALNSLLALALSGFFAA